MDTGTATATATANSINNAHPYMMATITPAGGIIVQMNWPNQPTEPLAFTNDSDFSAWLKTAIREYLPVNKIPDGIRPTPRMPTATLEEDRPQGMLRSLLGGRTQ
jgi:hypothetical protein